jgi:hypothetical protein
MLGNPDDWSALPITKRQPDAAGENDANATADRPKPA